MTIAESPPKRRYLRVLDKITVAALIFGVLILLLWPHIFVVIKPGTVGVLFRLFGGGTDTSFVYREGLAIKWPWNHLYIYEVRTQTKNYSVDALSGNGLTLRVEFSVVFHLYPDEVAKLHREIGPDYIDRIVAPVAVDAVRQVVGQYDPHKVYTVSAIEMQQQVESRLRAATRGTHIFFEAVVIRSLTLPEPVNAAINAKLAEEQYALSYVFRLQRERSEAERKHIEAIGIQNFYAIVANSLTPSLLTWRGMEATVEVARSPNSKVVIVGGGKDQMPLILGSDIGNLPAQAPGPVSKTPEPLPDLTKLPPLFPNAGLSPDVSYDELAVPPNSPSSVMTHPDQTRPQQSAQDSEPKDPAGSPTP